jgi:capsular polysaccharide biosynthesis protein
LFSSASHLISVHGAGLTNMLFMHTNTRVMEIRRRDDLLNYCYFFMAHSLGLKYYYFLADSAGISETVQSDQFLISNDLLLDRLRQFLCDE